MMNLEFIYLFFSRQHPATSPFQKVISIPRAAPDSIIRERATTSMMTVALGQKNLQIVSSLKYVPYLCSSSDEVM